MIAQSLSSLPSGLHISPIVQTKQWQIGQILNAIVDKADKSKLLEVRINQQTLKANGPSGIKEGDHLQLKVIDTGPRVVLKIVSHNRPEIKSAGAEQQLRQDLPKQKNILNLVETMVQLKNGKSQNVNRPLLPPNIHRQIAESVKLLPSLKQLAQPQLLKQSINDSGLFLETKLAQMVKHNPSSLSSVPPADVKTDLKASLLRLENAIQSEVSITKEKMMPLVKLLPMSIVSQNAPAPQQALSNDKSPEINLSNLRNAVQGAISKVQVNQSQTIINNENSMPQWLIDLPFLNNKRGGLLELIINQEKSGHDRTSPADKWTIFFYLTLDSLGKIAVQLSLSDNNLSTTLWAENESTNQQIDNNLASLRSRFQETGLNVVSLEHHPLTPVQTGLELRHSSLIKAKI